MNAEVIEALSNAWPVVVGSAFGVIAGTFIQFFLHKLQLSDTEKAQKAAFRKEMEYNLALINDLQQESQRLRNAVNGRCLPTYFGVMNLNEGIFLQTIELVRYGILYRWLDVPHVKKLQGVTSTLNVSTADWMNKEIAKKKDDFRADSAKFDQAAAVGFVDFIDDKLSETKADITELIARVR